ncbi:MAG TPA: hypothetical protein VFV57_03195 [Limnobacter sp.]|nr:hypothetical protein [Limnobacter sp.]
MLYTDERELVMDILKYGGDCTVQAPKPLAKRIRTMALALVANHPA